MVDLGLVVGSAEARASVVAQCFARTAPACGGRLAEEHGRVVEEDGSKRDQKELEESGFHIEH